MNKGVLTKAGAKRAGVPQMAGKEVEYSHISRDCAYNVYCCGEYIGSVYSVVGKTAAIIPDQLTPAPTDTH